MTFHRHFIQRPDFETAVITNEPAAGEQDYQSMILPPSPSFERYSRTRLSSWVHSARHRWGGRSIPEDVQAFVNDFQPDAIFTVAGAWSFVARLAERVATKNTLPLIGSFNDWWNYNQIYHPAFESALAKQFIDYYQRCDLAICTSEGMEDALGQHRNSVVLYPTGAEFQPTDSFSPPSGDQPFRIGFGGNLGDWYGTMIEALAGACSAELQFQIFGSRPSWSSDFDQRANGKGFFHGQVDFDTLTREMRGCDVLLLPMGFDPSIRQIESTSFKTKFLDYLTFEKPIFVWGPEYCSAVRTAREFDSAEVCTSDDAAVAAKLLLKLKQDPARQSQLVANSRKMYEDRFHPDRLHSELVTRITGLSK